MKTWIKKNKKASIVILILLLALLFGSGTGIFLTVSEEEESVYKETAVGYGPLTVGITEEGTVAVGTVEQGFDLDISEYTSSTEGARMGGGMGGPMGGIQISGSSSRQLEIEEVYVSVGQQITKGDPLFKLTDESVADIREELVSDEEDAKLTYDNLVVQQQKSSQEASRIYEQNQVYGNAAQLEYDEALHDLMQAAEDAQEALEDAQEDLAEYQEDLAEVSEDYEEAKKYLEETTAATESETETYWYLKNEESREAAKKVVEDEEDEIEELEDKIRDKEQEIVSLKAAYDDTVKAYQTGEADAKTQYDKRIFNLNKAAEIYSLATDQIEYQLKVAQEDYDDASEKLQAFDAYIIDGVVSAEYEGVVTEVSIEAGDEIQRDSAIATLNNYEDITISVDVDDDDMKAISVGDSVNLAFAAFPDGNFTGVVSDIGDATIDSNNDITYAVEISVGGDVSGLYEGMSGEVTFITKETKEVTYVSNRAIIREGTKSYVKVRDEQGNIEKIQVVTGFSDGSSVEIKEGLTEGDIVLIESKVKSE